MPSNYQELYKKIGKTKRDLGEIERCLKEGESLEKDLDKNAYQIEDRLKRAEEKAAKLKELEELRENLKQVTEFVEERKKALEPSKQKLKTYLGAELERRLVEKGWRISGNLPELRVGILSLEFLLTQGQVRIWYGPRIELLDRVELTTEALADSVIKTCENLENAGFKEEEPFLKLLFEAYDDLIKREGLEMGSNVPIILWLGQIAWRKQERNFLSDPRREYFKSYGRTQFSYDLSRLIQREYGPYGLRLVVASREQTKKKEDNLWVPTDSRGNGTHFSAVSFRRRSFNAQ